MWMWIVFATHIALTIQSTFQSSTSFLNRVRGTNQMRNKTSLSRLKLIQAGNAVSMVYQDFNKDLKRFGFVKKVKNAREKFQLPKRMN